MKSVLLVSTFYQWFPGNGSLEMAPMVHGTFYTRYSLLKVEVGCKVLEEDSHVSRVSECQKRDGVHEAFTDGWVGLHKGTLNVLQ